MLAFFDTSIHIDAPTQRTLLPGDYFHHDHRRTGIGRVEGDAYIAALAAFYALSPDVRGRAALRRRPGLVGAELFEVVDHGAGSIDQVS